jgi:hypothetical protein
MRLKHLSLLASASLCGILIQAGLLPTSAHAQALTGQVSSTEEGNMEGVLVSAKKDGSTVTITVVSDAKGQYSFPAGRLSAGKYTITTRAAGYDLVGPKTAEVPASGAATADLKLAKARNITAKLSSGEWLASIPGSDQQKAFMGQCVGCHTQQRVLTSSHTAEEYEQVFLRCRVTRPAASRRDRSRCCPARAASVPP